jgi:hypothetical protein
MDTEIIIFARYLDNHQLIGIPRPRLPQKAVELSSPCWLGERSRSALIAGKSNPKTDANIHPVVWQVLNNPMTTQR